MTNQIDELMALADEYATAIATQGEAHDHAARDALRQALEAALKPVEPTLWARYPRYTGGHQAIEVTLKKPEGKDWVAFCEVGAPPAQTPPSAIQEAEWRGITKANEKFAPIVKAALDLICAAHGQLETIPAPQRFGIPYAELNRLAEALGGQQAFQAPPAQTPANRATELLELFDDPALPEHSGCVSRTPPPRLTDAEIQKMWNWATIELPSPANCYKRGVQDGETAVRKQFGVKE